MTEAEELAKELYDLVISADDERGSNIERTLLSFELAHQSMEHEDSLDKILYKWFKIGEKLNVK